jgi:cell division septal protein FtsQ
MIKRGFTAVALLSLLVLGTFAWLKFDRPIDTIVIEGDLTQAEQGAMQRHISSLGLPGHIKS